MVQDNKYQVRTIIIISFLFLFLTAVMGVLLRTLPLLNLGVPYKNFIHAHSHGGFLGWLFLVSLAITISQLRLILSSRNVFWLKVDVIVLLLIVPFFMYYGYNVLTIALSAIHIFISAYLAMQFIKSSGGKSILNFAGYKSYFSLAWLFMVLSGIFPLFLGAVGKVFGAGSAAYFNTIYTYLHFQYNGFFTCIILGLIHRQVNSNNASAVLKWVYYSFIVSVILTVFNSYLWSTPPLFFNYISFMAVLIQLSASVALFLKREYLLLNEESKFSNVILWVLIALIIKSLMQLLSSLPFIAELISVNRFLVVFYLHFVLLGIITIPLIVTVAGITKIESFKTYRLAFNLILAAFVFTEIILAYKAAEFTFNIQNKITLLPSLALLSGLFPIGIFILFLVTLVKTPKT